MLQSHLAGPSFSHPQALVGRDFLPSKSNLTEQCVHNHDMSDDKLMTTTLERVLEEPIWGMSDWLLLFLRER